jgi:hypothetical protein
MSNNKDYDDFRVGDTVYCVIFGEGVVRKIYNGDNYPVLVEFNYEECRQSYTLSGKPSMSKPRTLFFTPPEVKPGSVKRPFVSKLIGKEVFVKSSDHLSCFGCVVTGECEKYLTVVSIFGKKTIQLNKRNLVYLRLLGEEIKVELN